MSTPNGTTGHNSLMDALVAFQSDAPHISLDSVNPHFHSKFASLPKIMDAVRPRLAAVGLAWVTMPGYVEGVGPVLHYQLAHAASGETLDGTMPLMVTKSDPQGFGSAITYARRYSVLAVLGLVGDEDDDANAASAAPAATTAPPADPPIAAARAKALVEAAWTVGVQDQLQLAATHVHGADVGACATKAAAVTAMRMLTASQAGRVEEWLHRKADQRDQQDAAAVSA